MKSFITLTELLLLTIDDVVAFVNGCSYPSSLDPMDEKTISSAQVRLMTIRLPSPVSATNKCIDKVIHGISSLHMKVAITSINLLRRNNILHNWILPLPIATLTSIGLRKEQRYREERLERLVDILRSNRKHHWSSEIRESCELFLDDLLDHLSG